MSEYLTCVRCHVRDFGLHDLRDAGHGVFLLLCPECARRHDAVDAETHAADALAQVFRRFADKVESTRGGAR